MLEIDDATASRLYLQCKQCVPLAKNCKESTTTEKTELVLCGVPCLIEFGFCFNKYSSRSGVHACAWIFSDCSGDFFGSFYLQVIEQADAQVILNSTICLAIERAKTDPKFRSLQATIVFSNPAATS